MARVEVVNWNPGRPIVPGIIGRALPFRRYTNNFGDLLGPMIVKEIVRKERLSPARFGSTKRLLAVGSILRLAQDGDVVWGTGMNGKSLTEAQIPSNIDVRAVRGPLTRDFLVSHGIDVPEVFGDPGLLIGHLWDRSFFRRGSRMRDVTVIPNLNDYRDSGPGDERTVDPTAPISDVLSAIASSRFVTGSSLHGIVIAESFGIPARLVTSQHEPPFKYQDYYSGSGRTAYQAAPSVEKARELEGEPPPQWDPSPLLDAFPRDLWS